MLYTEVLGLNTARLAAVIGRFITIDCARADADDSARIHRGDCGVIVSGVRG
jgi:hypothetical protein